MPTSPSSNAAPLTTNSLNAAASPGNLTCSPIAIGSPFGKYTEPRELNFATSSFACRDKSLHTADHENPFSARSIAGAARISRENFALSASAAYPAAAAGGPTELGPTSDHSPDIAIEESAFDAPPTAIKVSGSVLPTCQTKATTSPPSPHLGGSRTVSANAIVTTAS